MARGVRWSVAGWNALVACALPLAARAQETPPAPRTGAGSGAPGSSVATVGSPGTAPVGSAWRNPGFERARRILVEVIDRLRALHLDGDTLSPERLREEAIESLRAHFGSRACTILEPEARDRLRKALGRVPEGDLDACLALLDAQLGARPPEVAAALADVLARGAIAATHDPYTQLIDQRSLSRIASIMTGERTRGFGLKLGERDGVPTVEHVFSGYDASEKGVQDGDAIVEVDGRPTALTPREEVARRLAGDGRLSLRIFRDGFSRSQEVELEARVPRESNVVAEVLPGAIGYVRLHAFVAPTAEALEATHRHFEKLGVQALILDVRDNPGGSVDACARVARLFLPGDTLVCTTHERGAPPREVRTPVEGPAPSRLPLIVLTNRGSASASEMLAGALKDLGRARICGTRTIGKGVGQSPVFLTSANGERFVLMTTLEYRTPEGHRVQKVGVEPDRDLEVPAFAFSPAEQEEILRLTADDAFAHYLAQHTAPDAEALATLARDDDGRPERYPGFEAWARGLNTSLGPEALRRALRSAVRRWAIHSNGRSSHADLGDDAQLRRAHDLLLGELKARPPEPRPPRPTEPAPPEPRPGPEPRPPFAPDAPRPTPTPAPPIKRWFY